MDKKLYEIFSGKELEISEKIQQRRYQMIVHSCLYYELDTSIIPDYQWGVWGMELKQLQDQYPDIAKQVKFAEYFEDWDASTGFNLPIHDDWVLKRAELLAGMTRSA